MIHFRRTSLAVLGLAAVAALVTGCASSPGDSAPTSSPDESEVEAAWLDEGRMFAVVSWGSSSCVPVLDEVTADGQKVRLSLIDPPAGAGVEQACTKDMAPRASIGALPEGVDPAQDVELIVTLGDVTDDVDLDGRPTIAGNGGDSTEYLPSAGWYDDEGIVLLTWGSSSCPPVVESIEQHGGGVTVTFVTTDGVCTADMAPRATILELGEVDDDDDDDVFTLTLIGGGLDGTVEVLEG